MVKIWECLIGIVVRSFWVFEEKCVLGSSEMDSGVGENCFLFRDSQSKRLQTQEESPEQGKVVERKSCVSCCLEGLE